MLIINCNIIDNKIIYLFLIEHNISVLVLFLFPFKIFTFGKFVKFGLFSMLFVPVRAEQNNILLFKYKKEKRKKNLSTPLSSIDINR